MKRWRMNILLGNLLIIQLSVVLATALKSEESRVHATGPLSFSLWHCMCSL